MRVAGDEQVVAEGGALGGRVGRVHHGHPQPVGGVPGCDAEVVPPQVSVVEAEELDRQAVHLGEPPDIREIRPPVGDEPSDQLVRATPDAPPGVFLRLRKYAK